MESTATAFILKMTHSSTKQVVHSKRKVVRLGKNKSVSKQLWHCSPADLPSHTLHIFFIYPYTDQGSSLTFTPQSQHHIEGREQWYSQQRNLTAEHVTSSSKNPLLKNSQHQCCPKKIWIPRVTTAICKNKALASTCQKWEKVWLCKFVYV